jgi:hypothetical protein
MIVQKIEKKVQTTSENAVKYQIFTYCFFNSIHVTEAELDCLTQLALNQDVELTKFCSTVFNMKIFKSEQSVRNALAKAHAKNLITKHGKNKKTIRINDDMQITASGNIFLDFKILGSEPQKV